ncbi:hypothetical protein WKR88_12415 [Trinickia caryophylli]|uniref:Uncharacterized protein n=1 Tax=Trinickia caryophylli TaxID=28094 RepID=A0A1X7FIL5_TRICW|nr:hypothetical protein [Trinickia caryophylli]PMS13220.1 hypothetical protein C0Z17_05340 [Trinickia caryophylli]TRX19252.1 hypothetical protein FNF07_14130 [Trinickia caryophylli]WQE13446.1 hypothetical protein U0034_08805 [Trinickia caryophylli]SMF52706.1 hypothetical protein SAMN06295900_10969 [Trinickia caryophylli]GLU34030.1 hypothetical protein Busp01_38720 [Trinickia caryophylli]
MYANVFDPIPFIFEGSAMPLPEVPGTRYLFNAGGVPQFTSGPKGMAIDLAPENPDLALGAHYRGIGHAPKMVAGNPPYEITLFDFHAEAVHYEALPATSETAQAFGMTLLKSGQSIRFEYEGLVRAKYEYGKWAAHQSPYLEPERRRELLSWNPTDLEYHAFAHAFFSQDASLPLVISVARWRPYVDEISLADLWVAPGDALVLPPKFFPIEPPSEASLEERRRSVVDLHGNRNSALACWFDRARSTLVTETILANPEVMAAEATKPRYHEEVTGTRHVRVGG